jgi:hypothetical protein
MKTEEYKSEIGFAPYDPGSSFAVLWSHLLPAKRKINIYTLCRLCLDSKEHYSVDEQMNAITKVKNEDYV